MCVAFSLTISNCVTLSHKCKFHGQEASVHATVMKAEWDSMLLWEWLGVMCVGSNDVREFFSREQWLGFGALWVWKSFFFQFWRTCSVIDKITCFKTILKPQSWCSLTHNWLLNWVYLCFVCMKWCRIIALILGKKNVE